MKQIAQSYHRRYMAEILPIRRKTLFKQTINQSINPTTLLRIGCKTNVVNKHCKMAVHCLTD